MMIQRYNNVDSTLLQNSIIRLISNIESTSLQNLFFAAISNQRYNNVDSTLLQNLTIITFFDLIQCTIKKNWKGTCDTICLCLELSKHQANWGVLWGWEIKEERVRRVSTRTIPPGSAKSSTYPSSQRPTRASYEFLW